MLVSGLSQQSVFLNVIMNTEEIEDDDPERIALELMRLFGG